VWLLEQPCFPPTSFRPPAGSTRDRGDGRRRHVRAFDDEPGETRRLRGGAYRFRPPQNGEESARGGGRCGSMKPAIFRVRASRVGSRREGNTKPRPRSGSPKSVLRFQVSSLGHCTGFGISLGSPYSFLETSMRAATPRQLAALAVGQGV
jgi:hypothetical protein